MDSDYYRNYSTHMGDSEKETTNESNSNQGKVAKEGNHKREARKFVHVQGIRKSEMCVG